MKRLEDGSARWPRWVIYGLLACVVILKLAQVAQGQCSSSYTRTYRTYSAPTYSAPTYVAPPVAYSTYAAPTAKTVASYAYDEVKVVKFLAVLPLVALPSYAAVYSPPATYPLQQPQQQANPQASQMQQLLSQQGQLLEGLKKLDERLGRIEARVEVLERTRQPIQPQAPPPPKLEQGPAPKQEKQPDPLAKAVVVNQRKCAVCHERGNEAHGGDFVLSEKGGVFVRLTDTQLVSMQRQLTKGKMPPVASKRAKDAGVLALTKEEGDALFALIDAQIDSTK